MMSRVAPCPRISIFRRIHALGTSTALRFMLLVHILRYPSRSASIIAISDLIMTLTLFLCFSACLCAHIAPQLSLLGSHLAHFKGVHRKQYNPCHYVQIYKGPQAFGSPFFPAPVATLLQFFGA